MNVIERIYCENRDASGYAKGYLEYLREILLGVDVAQVGRFAETLLYARQNGGQVFFLGNGGSASTASHFANDLAIGTRSWEKPFKIVSLTDNVAVITAIGNDYSYDDIFLLQLKTLLNPGDVVVAISVSGNSPNVVKAIEYANSRDAITVGLTGFDGGKLKNIVKINLHAPTNKGEYGPAEDLHIIFNHLVGTYLMAAVKEENRSSEASIAV